MRQCSRRHSQRHHTKGVFPAYMPLPISVRNSIVVPVMNATLWMPAVVVPVIVVVPPPLNLPNSIYVPLRLANIGIPAVFKRMRDTRLSHQMACVVGYVSRLNFH